MNKRISSYKLSKFYILMNVKTSVVSTFSKHKQSQVCKNMADL